VLHTIRCGVRFPASLASTPLFATERNVLPSTSSWATVGVRGDRACGRRRAAARVPWALQHRVRLIRCDLLPWVEFHHRERAIRIVRSDEAPQRIVMQNRGSTPAGLELPLKAP